MTKLIVIPMNMMDCVGDRALFTFSFSKNLLSVSSSLKLDEILCLALELENMLSKTPPSELRGEPPLLLSSPTRKEFPERELLNETGLPQQLECDPKTWGPAKNDRL